ncbi:uncharacterized protein LOC106873034 isoform X1 [Octopus bimaculoides]|nr:uncharacterized protein LOC106873034 isoform X1 [Octopus bimaculoides]|eukprot:XP_014775727.1 PREDICTED: uncharacterized protein LOC106873034 [Octopus bimaculoides]
MERKAVKSGIFFCLLLCTSFASSFNSLSKYCRKSMNDNSTSGIFPHPERCDAYIQCVPRDDGPFAHEKICPSRLYFDPHLLTCNWKSCVLCEKGCKNHSKKNMPCLAAIILGSLIITTWL